MHWCDQTTEESALPARNVALMTRGHHYPDFGEQIYPERPQLRIRTATLPANHCAQPAKRNATSHGATVPVRLRYAARFRDRAPAHCHDRQPDCFPRLPTTDNRAASRD
ncbi:hypothetical protein GCM10010361_42650 [Streptomyces olivaceiscleroticus]|uniref:Uncharacterized protein n=1 Tax=Streptomyces olivaceiscleroticus TaxID=68245 RepID=A0ABN1ADH7_9ACTN